MFLGPRSQRLHWMTRRRPYQETAPSPRQWISIRWFEDGFLNASSTAIDRHLSSVPSNLRSSVRAYDPSQSLHHHLSAICMNEEVCKFANSHCATANRTRRAEPRHHLLPMIRLAGYPCSPSARHRRIHSVCVRRLLADIARRPGISGPAIHASIITAVRGLARRPQSFVSCQRQNAAIGPRPCGASRHSDRVRRIGVKVSM